MPNDTHPTGAAARHPAPVPAAAVSRRHHPGRRQLLRSALSGGLALAGWPAIAAAAVAEAAASAVYIGFSAAGDVAAVSETLQALQGHYEPRLPLTLTRLPGNATARAMEAVHNGPADGSSVLLSPSGVMTLSPNLRTLPGVDPVKDLVAVSPLGEFAHSFVVGPAVPAAVTTLNGYLDWVRDNPTQSVYGVAALGVPPHLAGISMARSTGIPFKPVFYQGPLPMHKDVADGHMPAAFLVMVGGRESLDVGSGIRQLALVADRRWPGQPEVPTLAELGITDVSTVESWGFYLPARTPPAIVQALNEAVQEALLSEPVAAAMRRLKLRAKPMTAGQFAASLAEERANWRAIVAREHFSLNG